MSVGPDANAANSSPPDTVAQALGEDHTANELTVRLKPDATCFRPLQRLRCFSDLRGQRVDRRRHRAHAALRLGEAALLQTFANLRHRLHAVAGVKPGRVDLMLEPVASRQAVAVAQLALRAEQQLVQLLQLAVPTSADEAAPTDPRQAFVTLDRRASSASTAHATGSRSTFASVLAAASFSSSTT